MKPARRRSVGRSFQTRAVRPAVYLHDERRLAFSPPRSRRNYADVAQLKFIGSKCLRYDYSALSSKYLIDG